MSRPALAISWVATATATALVTSMMTALVVAGCTRKDARPELVVFAAVSTNDAMREVSHAFEASHGVHVRFSFGASSDLARQITAGAPADVFLSADQAKMNDLLKRGLVRTPVELLGNVLAVIVPVASTREIRQPSDLGALDKIALPDTGTVPIGIYARTWLEKRGAWVAVAPKLVTTLDARATLAAVETGAVDAGIVYRTDANASNKVRVVIDVPRDEGPPIVYPVAVVTASKSADAARFVSYLGEKVARDTFAKYGFAPL